jgi:hypothetical protein
MSATTNGNHANESKSVDESGLPDSELNADYEPGETLHRGMSVACGLILLALALISCGFVASVLILHSNH